MPTTSGRRRYASRTSCFRYTHCLGCFGASSSRRCRLRTEAPVSSTTRKDRTDHGGSGNENSTATTGWYMPRRHWVDRPRCWSTSTGRSNGAASQSWATMSTDRAGLSWPLHRTARGCGRQCAPKPDGCVAPTICRTGKGQLLRTNGPSITKNFRRLSKSGNNLNA
jgi:hypothetical protein